MKRLLSKNSEFNPYLEQHLRSEKFSPKWNG